jgi:hypothetical protein
MTLVVHLKRAPGSDSAGIMVLLETTLETTEQVRQTCLKPLRDPLDIHQRDVAHSALNSTVVGPVQPAALSRLFLVDLLRLAYSANCAAKPNPDVDGH